MPVCMFKDTVLTGLNGGTASSAVHDSLLPTKLEPFFLAQCTHQVFVPLKKKCQQQHSVSNQLQLTFFKYTIMQFLCNFFFFNEEEEKCVFLSEAWRLIDRSQQVELEPKWHLPGLHLSGSYVTVWMVIFSFFTLKSFRSFYLYMYHFQICCLFCCGGGKGSLLLVLVPSCTWQHSKYAPFFLSHVSSPTASLCFVLKMVYMCVAGVMLHNIPNLSISLLLRCWFFCPLSYLILKICYK